MTRPATLVDWAFAPDWLTLAEACQLTGYAEETLRELVERGDIDSREAEDGWLIEKRALREFHETLAEVLTSPADVGRQGD